MSKIVAYPAVLDDRENDPGVYTVTFPDVPAAITDGKTLAEALTNGAEVLGLVLYDEEELPVPSPLKAIAAANPDAVVSYISTDLDRAKAESHAPMVKKNTRIPADLAAEAEAQGVNFSATLTMALRELLAK